MPDWLESLTPDEREGWDEFVDHFRREALEKLAGSAAMISIVPTKPEYLDVKFAVELGASIMLDKPILAVVHPGVDVPEKMRRVVDEIVEVDIDTEEGQRVLADSVASFFQGLGLNDDAS